MKLEENIKTEFHQYKNQAEENAFFQMREKAFAEFDKNGFPTIKNEEWKYTNLKSIFDKNFKSTCVSSANVKNLLVDSVFNSIKANKLVFVNGSFNPELSNIIEKDNAIVISNLAKARKENTNVFDAHFGKYAKIENESLNAMNMALMSDGAFVYVPSNKKVENPIIIMNVVDSTDINVLSQPRNLIVIEKNAEACIVESYISAGTNASFINVVNEIYVDENAHLEHYKIQQQTGESYQNNYTQIFQEANTNINQVTLTLDGTMVRNNLHFYMNGKNCDTLLYGLYITEGSNHVDNHTRVDHAMPNCHSNELYKGIMKDKSTAVFNGKIMVHLDAQKTNAYQRNQNILLDPEATINTKPQLEIFADDVKCTHGATVGQLDEEPMFYLRSRGIPEDVARKMLLNAFADDIAEKIKIPELVGLLEQLIEEKL
ncbi:MAG: Fe-S cluster assembly protein SufD [Bacteroidetes bacterium]|nr:Fe-S cluster assembly protein SufD [Bacteroidota bacterium]